LRWDDTLLNWFSKLFKNETEALETPIISFLDANEGVNAEVLPPENQHKKNQPAKPIFDFGLAQNDPEKFASELSQEAFEHSENSGIPSSYAQEGNKNFENFGNSAAALLPNPQEMFESFENFGAISTPSPQEAFENFGVTPFSLDNGFKNFDTEHVETQQSISSSLPSSVFFSPETEPVTDVKPQEVFSTMEEPGLISELPAFPQSASALPNELSSEVQWFSPFSAEEHDLTAPFGADEIGEKLYPEQYLDLEADDPELNLEIEAGERAFEEASLWLFPETTRFSPELENLESGISIEASPLTDASALSGWYNQPTEFMMPKEAKDLSEGTLPSHLENDFLSTLPPVHLPDLTTPLPFQSMLSEELPNLDELVTHQSTMPLETDMPELDLEPLVWNTDFVSAEEVVPEVLPTEEISVATSEPFHLPSLSESEGKNPEEEPVLAVLSPFQPPQKNAVIPVIRQLSDLAYWPRPTDTISFSPDLPVNGKLDTVFSELESFGVTSSEGNSLQARLMTTPVLKLGSSEVLSVSSVNAEQRFLLVKSEMQYALIGQWGITDPKVFVLKLFDDNPIAYQKTFTAVQDQRDNEEGLYLLQVGHWRGIVSIYQMTMTLYADLG
jgi:hypothetical protein